MINDFINKEVYEELLKIWKTMDLTNMKVKTKDGHDLYKFMPEKHNLYTYFNGTYYPYILEFEETKYGFFGGSRWRFMRSEMLKEFALLCNENKLDEYLYDFDAKANDIYNKRMQEERDYLKSIDSPHDKRTCVQITNDISDIVTAEIIESMVENIDETIV
ncbi:MAG: TnpV protein [Bacillota bacterium]